MAGHTTESKTERMLTIYHRLYSGEVVRKQEIAELFQVNARSVQRDIDDLRAYFANGSPDQGVHPSVLYDRKMQGYVLDCGSRKMTGGELLAVCKILLESRAFTRKELEPLVEKLVYNCCPPPERKLVEEMIGNEQFHYTEPHHHKEFIPDLWEIGKAVRSQRHMEMDYARLGDTGLVHRLVRPVGIMFSEYYFYLVAFIERREEEGKEYPSPAVYRIDRIHSYRILDSHFPVPYRNRFEEGEFRKRVQFMYGGKLQRIVFEYRGPSPEAVLDRLPTAVVVSRDRERNTCTVRAEVFGDGIDMWLRSQGEQVRVISRKVLGQTVTGKENQGEGVTYETAGSLQDGRRTWILARLPQKYIISGDEVTPYLVFMNSHDGSGAVRAAMTPVRVVCQNTLNLALETARRSWSTTHVGDVRGKLEDARDTLLYAGEYMAALGKAVDSLNRRKLTDRQVYEYIDALSPLADQATETQKKNLMRMKEDMKTRYFDAPDLRHVGKNAYRFVNAVSDFATHAKPLRERAGYRENLFARTVDGNAMTDRAYALVKAA